jgi:Anti-sigma-K factor rskA/Putative zinc-finger
VRFLREELHALTGAYALDALDSAERDRFARHLHRCPACGNEVRGMRETAARLGMAVAAVPPAHLRERVLAAAASTRQLPPEAQPRPARGTFRAGWPVWARPSARVRPSRSSRPGGRDGRDRESWFPRPAALLAAAAAAVAIVLGVTQVVTQRELGHAQAQTQAVESVLSAPDARLVTRTISAGGWATVVVSQSRHALVLTTSGLPALPAAKVYEVWYMKPGDDRPAGLLSAPAAGRTAPLLADRLGAGDQIGVTVEPAGGTSRPTTAPILLMSLPA